MTSSGPWWINTTITDSTTAVPMPSGIRKICEKCGLQVEILDLTQRRWTCANCSHVNEISLLWHLREPAPAATITSSSSMDMHVSASGSKAEQPLSAVEPGFHWDRLDIGIMGPEMYSIPYAVLVILLRAVGGSIEVSRADLLSSGRPPSIYAETVYGSAVEPRISYQLVEPDDAGY